MLHSGEGRDPLRVLFQPGEQSRVLCHVDTNIAICYIIVNRRVTYGSTRQSTNEAGLESGFKGYAGLSGRQTHRVICQFDLQGSQEKKEMSDQLMHFLLGILVGICISWVVFLIYVDWFERQRPRLLFLPWGMRFKWWLFWTRRLFK